MNYLSSFKKLSRAKQVAVVLIGSTLAWTVGLPTFFTTASAAQLQSISMTASSTVPSALTNYKLQYTSTNAVAAAGTIKISLSYTKSGGTDEYDISNLVAADLVVSGMNMAVGGVCGAPANEVVATFSNAGGDRSVTLTVCAGDTVTAGAKTIWFTNSHVTNPSTAGSYKINVAGTQTDSGTTMTAILSQVTVTAAVDTSFTFTVAGLASGQAINGTTTSTTTTATAIGFGTLVPGIPVVAGQELTVTTNAQNGFLVTVHEDQNLLSGNGADIDLFKDGTAVSSPTAWTAPATTLGNENTYGHFGLLSNDSDLVGGAFGSNLWVGNFYSSTTRNVFSHNGPSDGTTQDIGKARVAYAVQISALQEAANDYSNHLIYVATPVF